ncbi:MAG: hypothetical protein ABW252_09255 [Polyangiales bacterium]
MDAPSTVDAPDDLVLWDVVEEHLDEADFLFGQWQRGQESSLYTLDTLAKGPEARLLAHVDGLVVNGKPVIERTLLPAVRTPEEPSVMRAAAASLALIGLGRHDVVADVLLHGDAETSRGAEYALALAGPAAFDAWLPRALPSGLDRGQRAALLRVAAARGLTIANLLLYLQSQDTHEAAAAAHAAIWSDGALHAPLLDYLLDDPRPEVADAALTAALVHGSRAAFQRCLARASDTTQSDGLAMLLTALLGQPSHHDLLTAHIGRGTHRMAALFALGYTGQAATVPLLLAQLEAKDAPTRKLASEAIGTITGLDTTADAFVREERVQDADALPPLEVDIEAELVPTHVDALPEPNAEAIGRWWNEHGGRIDRRCRVLLGEPWTYEHALSALASSSMRRRAPLVRWLQVRSGGHAKVVESAFSSTQRAQARAAACLATYASTRRYGSW